MRKKIICSLGWAYTLLLLTNGISENCALQAFENHSVTTVARPSASLNSTDSSNLETSPSSRPASVTQAKEQDLLSSSQRDTTALPTNSETLFFSNGTTTLGSYDKVPSPQRFPVKSIFIRIDNQVPENEDFIRTHLRFTEGEDFDPYAANDAIHSLYAAGMFDKITISATQNPDRSLNVFVEATTLPKIASIKFPHERITKKKLRKELKTTANTYLNRANLNEDILTIYKYYQLSGFPKPEIHYEIIPVGDHLVDVVFDIQPSEALRISQIRFYGFGDVDTKAIQKEMFLKVWHRNPFSFFTKKGYYGDVLVEHDKEVIVNAMHDAGYLDAKLTSIELITEGENKGTLAITADLGQKYFAGDISYEGNQLYNQDQMLKLTAIHPTNAFSPRRIAQTIDNIQSFYRYHGYVNTFVDVNKIPTFQDNIINLHFLIQESPLYYVNAITINGNYKTKNKVILRELALSPGDIFNATKMQNSESRLKNTGFFKTVSVEAVDSDLPEHKDISIEVKEAETGNLQVGAAISARKNQIVFCEISQSNFDLFNPHARFQGGGEKARARLQLGTRDSEAFLSFEEPYLYDKELAFGTDFAATKTKYRRSDDNYSGPTYDENAVYIEPYFRKRVYELWVALLGYNLRRSKLTNLRADAVTPLKEEAAKGRRTASSLKLSLERDTRDNYIFPRHGALYGIDTRFCGLGGNTKFIRTTLAANRWIHVSDKYDHTLQLTGKIGAISPFQHQSTPYSERYFLGGDTMMRGFEFREISPKERVERAPGPNGEKRYRLDPVGGNSFCYGNIEYTANLFDNFFGALFFEVGAVNAKKTHFFKNINSDWGIGLRIFINNMPLRLDWGFPIHCAPDTRKDGVQFNFSFGGSF